MCLSRVYSDLARSPRVSGHTSNFRSTSQCVRQALVFSDEVSDALARSLKVEGDRHLLFGALKPGDSNQSPAQTTTRWIQRYLVHRQSTTRTCRAWFGGSLGWLKTETWSIGPQRKLNLDGQRKGKDAVSVFNGRRSHIRWQRPSRVERLQADYQSQVSTRSSNACLSLYTTIIHDASRRFVFGDS